MVRTAGCIACLALLLAMPGLRTLCADYCPPASRTEEPPCHDGRGDPVAPPPGGPVDGCAHGDALSSTAARPALDGADAPSATPVYWYLHGRAAVGQHPAVVTGPAVAAFAPDRFPPRLRC
jgi:hypothetical protein